MLRRVIDGRTDLVFDYLEAGNAATSTDEHGTPLVRWCAYHGESLDSLGENLDLNSAAFEGQT